MIFIYAFSTPEILTVCRVTADNKYIAADKVINRVYAEFFGDEEDVEELDYENKETRLFEEYGVQIGEIYPLEDVNRWEDFD